jgi:hypothetical protein
VKKILEFRFWIIGFVGCAFFVCFMAYQEHCAADKYKNHRAEYCSALIATAEQKKACIEERTSARDYLPWRYELFSWPEGITTWAIILTGFAIAWQSYETRKAAESMVLGTKANIEAQRARIVIENTIDKPSFETEPHKWSFDFSAKNMGLTEADVFEICESTEVLSRAEFMEAVNGKVAPPKKRSLAESFKVSAGGSSPFGRADGDMRAVHRSYDLRGRRDTIHLVYYGWLRYRDFAGGVHRRKFFYAYSPAAMRFLESGPTGYNAED